MYEGNGKQSILECYLKATKMVSFRNANTLITN